MATGSRCGNFAMQNDSEYRLFSLVDQDSMRKYANYVIKLQTKQVDWASESQGINELTAKSYQIVRKTPFLSPRALTGCHTETTMQATMKKNHSTRHAETYVVLPVFAIIFCTVQIKCKNRGLRVRIRPTVRFHDLRHSDFKLQNLLFCQLHFREEI